MHGIVKRAPIFCGERVGFAIFFGVPRITRVVVNHEFSYVVGRRHVVKTAQIIHQKRVVRRSHGLLHNLLVPLGNLRRGHFYVMRLFCAAYPIRGRKHVVRNARGKAHGGVILCHLPLACNGR